MAEWLRMHTSLAEDPGSGPSMDVRQLTTARNSGTKRFDTSDLLRHLHIHAHTSPRHTHI